MKRLLSVFAVCAALTASAKSEKAVIVRVADTAGISTAITHIGSFTGNPMLAMPLSAAIAGNPLAQLLGPGRAGAATVFVITVDPEKLGVGSIEKVVGEQLQASVLYPVSQDKAAFLAAHPGAEEKDGAIKVPGRDDMVVAFSADGRWAALADSPALAVAALADVPRAEKAQLKGDLVQFACTPAGMALVGRVVESAVQESAARMEAGRGKASVERVMKLIRQVQAYRASLRIDAEGVMVQATVVPVAGSDLSRIGLEPLSGGAPLAFAGTDSFYACASARNCMQGDFDASWSKLTALVAKHGIDMAWLACTRKDAARVLTFDLDGCIGYFRGEGKAKFDAVDPETFMKDFSALNDDDRKVEGPAVAFAMALKGMDAKTSPAARFARLAPEAAAKKPYSVGAGSFYALISALAPKLVALVPEEDKAIVKPQLEMLPPAGEGGFAIYGWREGEAIKAAMRVSPDEIRGLGTLGSVAFGYFAMQQMKAGACELDFDDSGEEDSED